MNLRPELLQHPPIPRPLHGIAPRTVLGPAWWKQEQKRAKAATKNHCLACGVHKSKAQGHKWMEAHECYLLKYFVGLMIYVETVPLCHYCHAFIHRGRSKRMMSVNKYQKILTHGKALLRKAGLKMPKKIKIVRTWSEWSLMIHGQQYPGHQTLKEWKTKYGVPKSRRS